MLEKYEVCCGLFHGFDYATVLRGSSAQKLAGVTAAMDHVLALNDGKKRLLEAVGLLSKAFALAGDDFPFAGLVSEAVANPKIHWEDPGVAR